MRYGLLIVGAGGGFSTPFAGCYVEAFDPEANEGRGEVTVTRDSSKALTFPTPVEVFKLWKTQSKTVPFRPDGKPNRPLTSYTVEVVTL